MSDIVLFVALPYVAVVLAVLGSSYRYATDKFSYSSQSSQFLEKRTLFWGSIPWHYGIITILSVHVIAGFFPGLWGDLIAPPARLYVLEVTGLALALITIVGLSALIFRRVSRKRIRMVTSTMDWVLLALLLTQIVLGFWVALFYRWGSQWYLYKAVPWLGSLLRLDPDVSHIDTLPWPVKLHFIGGFIIIGLIPFTRLMHLFGFPLRYLWRPYQLVIWNRDPKERTEREAEILSGSTQG